jgi:hypothetical protein
MEEHKMDFEKFGLTKEAAEAADEIGDYYPSFPLGKMGVGERAEMTIMSDCPVNKEVTNRNDEKVIVPVLSVKDKLTGVLMTLWLSSESLKREFYRLSKNKKTLKGTHVSIFIREYEHKQYGLVRAYSVQEITQ